jgi:hypothetical protein
MKLTYQDVLDDPSLIRNITAAAHRERANAMHELIVLPIKRLFTDHAPRSHFARQG